MNVPIIFTLFCLLALVFLSGRLFYRSRRRAVETIKRYLDDMWAPYGCAEALKYYDEIVKLVSSHGIPFDLLKDFHIESEESLRSLAYTSLKEAVAQARAIHEETKRSSFPHMDKEEAVQASEKTLNIVLSNWKILAFKRGNCQEPDDFFKARHKKKPEISPIVMESRQVMPRQA